MCDAVLTLTRGRASERASQHAPDLYLQSAYCEYATRMRTGRDPGHSPSVSRDLFDRRKTATGSCRIQTGSFVSGETCDEIWCRWALVLIVSCWVLDLVSLLCFNSLAPHPRSSSFVQWPRSGSIVQFPFASEVAEGDQETRGLERKCVDDDAQNEFECQNLNLRYPYLLCCAASILHKSSQGQIGTHVPESCFKLTVSSKRS